MDIQEILIAAGAIAGADIRPYETARVAKDGRRLVFGPATTETGEAAEGWDATEYIPRDNPDDGEYESYTYAETDGEMVALAAKYA